MLYQFLFTTEAATKLRFLEIHVGSYFTGQQKINHSYDDARNIPKLRLAGGGKKAEARGLAKAEDWTKVNLNSTGEETCAA